MSRWFRLYDDCLDDPKVQRLPPDLFKIWINLLCLASRNGGNLPCMEDIAFALRIDEAAADQAIGVLIDRGLLDDGDIVRPHNWDSRQFKSDADATSSDRQRKKRERDKQQVVTRDETDDVTRDKSVTSRPPETDTDTDSENRKSSPVGDWTALEAKLRKAAGWENEPHPGLCVIGPIVGLIEAGASLELDILPVVAARAPKVRARAWTYFVGPVQDAMAARLGAAIPQSRAPPDSEFGRKSADAELQRLSEETGWKPGKKATASTPAIS